MSLAGEAIVAIWHDIMDEGRDEFYWWHVHEHIPERVSVPGFLRGRRYIAEDGAPEFFTLYEAETIETLGGRDYLDRLNDPTEWTTKTVKYFTNVARSLQRVHYSKGPGIGGHLLSYFFEIDGDVMSAGDFVQRMIDQALDPIAAEYGICGVHLGETDHSISDTPTTERKRRSGGTDMPGWSLLIEAARRDDLDRVRNAYLGGDTLRQLGLLGEPGYGLYRLEYVRTKPRALSEGDG